MTNHHDDAVSQLLTKAVNFPRDEQTRLLQDTQHYNCVLVYALDNHPKTLFEQLLELAPADQKNRFLEGQNQLTTLNFDFHLAKINEKLNLITKHWFKNKGLVQATEQLRQNLNQARIDFLQSDEPINARKQALKHSCLAAIAAAKPIFKPQRGFGIVTDAFMNLWNLLSILRQRFNTGQWHWIQSPSDSSQKAGAIKAVVDQISIEPETDQGNTSPPQLN